MQEIQCGLESRPCSRKDGKAGQKARRLAEAHSAQTALSQTNIFIHCYCFLSTFYLSFFIFVFVCPAVLIEASCPVVVFWGAINAPPSS